MTDFDSEEILHAQIKATLARIKEARALIRKHGPTLSLKDGTFKLNPALRFEESQRIVLLRLLKALPRLSQGETFEEAIERLMEEGPVT